MVYCAGLESRKCVFDPVLTGLDTIGLLYGNQCWPRLAKWTYVPTIGRNFRMRVTSEGYFRGFPMDSSQPAHFSGCLFNAHSQNLRTRHPHCEPSRQA